MITRRTRVQDKKTARNALLLILSSVVLILLFIFYGLPLFARIAIFIGDFKKSSQPVLQKDTVPPGPPRINQLPSYTNNKTATISGAAEAGSTLKFFINDQLIKETLIDDSSLYSFVATLNKGENRLTATTTDQASNESEKSPIVRIVYSNEEPELSITSPKDGEVIDTTNSITIEGKTTAGNRLTINERIIIVNEQGDFSTKYSLSEGENHLLFTVEDQAGNLVEKEIIVTYTP